MTTVKLPRGVHAVRTYRDGGEVAFDFTVSQWWQRWALVRNARPYLSGRLGESLDVVLANQLVADLRARGLHGTHA